MKRNELYALAITEHGTDLQQLVAIEEMAELTQAIIKFKRKEKHNIAEEVADVEIMLEQLKLMHGITGDVYTIKRSKKVRLYKNLIK